MVDRLGKKEGKLLAQYELKRALEEIKTAKLLENNGIYFKSVVSSYYAVYHAAKASLLFKGIAPKSHEGVERMFSLYYIKTKEIREEDVSRIIGRLMKLREEADYYPESSFSIKDSAEAFEMAERFVKVIKKVIRFEN
ncbi:MAG: HEPN domain-containing protein [Nitrospirae bacterium]|nr:HEPN domain-containing protein [Nitrospirota bacterium]MCL5237499.1 HEPN domain-containing protein [Nitrospirota bacterium]